MADPKRVDPNAGGLGVVADLLNLLGGQKSTTTTTGDTGALKGSIGALQGMDPNALLQSIFQQAAGQIPGLQAAHANAVGARTGNNSVVATSLDKLLQDATIKAQGQIMQQQLQNQQLQIQAGGAIAGANKTSQNQSGTNLQKGGQLLALGSGVSKLLDSGLGKQVVGKGKGLFDSMGSPQAMAPDIGSQLPATFGNVDAPISIADAAPQGNFLDPTSLDFGFSPNLGLSLGGAGTDLGLSSTPVDEGSVLDLFGGGFADGGLVPSGRRVIRRYQAAEDEATGIQNDDNDRAAAIKAANDKGRKSKSGLSDYDKSSKMVDPETGIRFADGGQVPGKQGQVKSAGGRAGSGPSFTMDGITLNNALQGGVGSLNPDLLKQVILAGLLSSAGGPSGVSTGENSPNATPEGGFSQGLSGMAAPAGMAIGGMFGGVPGLGIALGLAAQAHDNANQALTQDTFNKDAIQFANAHEGTANPGMSEAGAHEAATGIEGINNGGLAGMGVSMGLGADSDGSTGIGVGGESSGPGSNGDGVGGYQAGGKVNGPKKPVDSIPVRVTGGEYIMPEDVVTTLGADFFDNIKALFHTPQAKQEQMQRNTKSATEVDMD